MDVWPRCLERLEAELPAEEVHTWLKPLQAGSREDGFVLYAPNAFVMEEVRSRYLPRIQELLAHFAGNGHDGVYDNEFERLVNAHTVLLATKGELYREFEPALWQRTA